jgi:hypothetical protein
VKRVTNRAWFSAICISALLVAGSAVPSAFGTGTKAESEASDQRELTVRPGGSDSATVSRPSDRRGPNTLKDADVTLSEYDAKAGRAVVSDGDRGGGGVDIRKGDVIASPPTKAAPEGALVKVKDVRSDDGGETEVSTSRASLAEVLGGAKADGKIPVSSSEWKVDPLVKGLDVAQGGAAKDSRGDAEDLNLDFDTELPDFGDKPGPDPGTEVGGYLEMSPKVNFSYDGNGSLDPRNANASIGVGGDYKAGWRLKGKVTAPHIDERIPLAEVSAHPVFMVGPIPVVVSMKLTLVLRVRADGEIQMDVRQDTSGSVKVGTRYSKEAGWESDSHAEGTTQPGGKNDIAGKGELRANLGPEANVSLYDTVGVNAFFSPYLRATAEYPEQAPGADAGERGAWNLYGGLSLESYLYAQLPFAVIGNRPSHRIDFPTISREWFIAKGAI